MQVILYASAVVCVLRNKSKEMGGRLIKKKKGFQQHYASNCNATINFHSLNFYEKVNVYIFYL